MSKSVVKSEKKELKTKESEEKTYAGRYYTPHTDIVETSEALHVNLDVPGVKKEAVEVNVENDTLKIDGKIDFEAYKNLKPIFTEYNVGHYSRSFTLSNKIDRDGIQAKMEDGVLNLILPKLPESQPRKISVN